MFTRKVVRSRSSGSDTPENLLGVYPRMIFLVPKEQLRALFRIRYGLPTAFGTLSPNLLHLTSLGLNEEALIQIVFEIFEDPTPVKFEHFENAKIWLNDKNTNYTVASLFAAYRRKLN